MRRFVRSPARSTLRMCCIFGLSGIALLGTQPYAKAAFETWLYPAPPLPYSCDTVTFERSDRRDEVVSAVRSLMEKHLSDSGACTPTAPSALNIVVSKLDTTATVAPDGSGQAKADILYRVTDSNGRVLLNDRIHTTASVTIEESLRLQQSSKRAARYRAFTANLSKMLIYVGMAVNAPGSTPTSYRLPKVVLKHPLETKHRTSGLAERFAETAALLQAPEFPMTGYYSINSLSLKQARGALRDQSDIRMRLGYTLYSDAGVPIASATANAKAEIEKQPALTRGLSPLDAATAKAIQTAVRETAPDLLAHYRVFTQQTQLSQGIHIPYTMKGLKSVGASVDQGLLAHLRNWTQADTPFAKTWDGGTPLTIRVDSIQTKLTPASHGGRVSIVGTYSILSDDGSPLLITRQTGTAEFDKHPTRQQTQDAVSHARQIALMKSWAGLLQQLQNTPNL